VNVTLTVGSPPPTITVSPASLSFTYTTSQPIAGNSALSSTFILSNTGSATAATLSVTGASWLKITPTGNIQLAGLFNSITVSVDPTGLAPKTYTANIQVKSAQAANPSFTVPVTLSVVAAAPSILTTWPLGLIQQSGQSTVTLTGQNYFATTTASVTGFTPETQVTATDSSGTAMEPFYIPVYAAANNVLKIMMGSPLPGGIVGTPIAPINLAASGGTAPYLWFLSAGTMPPGLSISSGQIVGTPSSAGSYFFTVGVQDSTTPIPANTYMPFKMIIIPAGAPPSVVTIMGPTSPIVAGTMGTAYPGGVAVATIGGTGTPTYAASALPAGLAMASVNGLISGTPTSIGTTGSLTAKAVGDTSILATVPASYLTSAGYLRFGVATPAPGGGLSNEAQFQIFGPQPQVLAVVNAGSFKQGTISPGEILTIFGSGLGPTPLAIFNPASPAPQIPTALPATSPSTTVTINGIPAPILYTSANQVSVVAPYSLSGSSASLVLSYNGLASQTTTLALAATNPGVFTTDASGKGQGAILNYNAATNDYTLNGGTAPATKGQTVVLYVTGIGVTNVPLENTLVPATPAVTPSAAVTVTVGGQPATVVGVASPPGSVPGLLQINAQIPNTAPTGAALPVVVNIGGVDSQAGVTMAVK
jgi:uncharacterized protein (TIGR03437 family)